MQQIRNNDPYLLGVFTDDGDYFLGAGAGPDFATGHTNANVAWMTLITSPVQTYIQSTPFGKQNVSLSNYAELFEDSGNESDDALFHLEPVQPARLPVAEVRREHIRA